MSETFFDRPILNSPYAYPGRHWELDADGQPTNRVLDVRRRSDLITPVPKLKSRYLSQLRSVADGILEQSDSWNGHYPSYDAAPTPVRGVNAKTLRSVVVAIRRSEAIEVKYQSLSRPEPSWRWIAPHALGFDGFRWHIRAFSPTDQSFKDFLLSRIIETRGTKPSEVGANGDTDWNEQVTLEMGPHPELSETQQKVIALDYGMRDGRAKLPVRKALLYYSLKRLGLDTDPTAWCPRDQQIVLLNRDTIRLQSGNSAQ